MADSFDAVIIGAGVFGSGIAFELSRRGVKTCNVDMFGAPGHGSTSSSGAIIRFNYTTVPGVQLAWEGNRYWENFDDYLETTDDLGHARKVKTGSLFLRTHEEFHQIYLRCMSAVGVPHEEWSPEQVAVGLPPISLDAYGPPTTEDDERFWAEPHGIIPGALYTPDAGHISDPQLAAQNLHTAAKAKGGEFRFNTTVTEILTTDDASAVRGVKLGDGTEIHAPIVVNVGGPFSTSINDLAGLGGADAIATRPMRHEIHVAAAPEGVDYEADGMMVADLDQGMYFRPEAGNQIFIGSADPECDGEDWVDDMATLNREITEARWNLQTMRLAKRIPTFGVPHQKKGLADAYDVSSDWGPIYDRTDLDGFFAARGTSGNQFKNACVGSHMMAELITAVSNGHDHDNDPLVVTGRYTDAALNMGEFSRNRTINPDSTGTVLG